MRRYYLALGFLVSSCSDSAPTPNDPYRAEFLPACAAQKAYQSRPAEKVKTHCACVYDRALKGLTEEEAMTARFYLFGQSGIDVKTRDDFTSRDMTVVADTMVPASNAIGQAVKACGRP